MEAFRLAVGKPPSNVDALCFARVERSLEGALPQLSSLCLLYKSLGLPPQCPVPCPSFT